MSVAPAATEVVSEPARWTGFKRSAGEGNVRPRRWLDQIRSQTGRVLYRYGGGTTTINEWLPAAAQALTLETIHGSLREAYRGADLVMKTASGVLVFEIKLGSIQITAQDLEDEPVPALPETALIAKEVRDLSGLSAARLGDIFPIERETFQRWMSGRITPPSANLERLLALRHFLRELANRTEDPKSVLLSPLSEGQPSDTLYGLLKSGNLSAAWGAIANMTSTASRYTRETEDGAVLTVTRGSLRGRDVREAEEDLGNYDEWLSEDE